MPSHKPEAVDHISDEQEVTPEIAPEKKFGLLRHFFPIVLYNLLCFWLFLYNRSWGFGLTLFEVAHLLPHFINFTKISAIHDFKKSSLVMLKAVAAIGLSIFFWQHTYVVYQFLVLLCIAVLNLFLIHEMETGEFLPLSFVWQTFNFSLSKFWFYTGKLFQGLQKLRNINIASLRVNRKFSDPIFKRVVVGLIVSVPVVAILILLFSSADQNFADIFINLGKTFQHFFGWFDWIWKFDFTWIAPVIIQFTLFWLYLCLIFPLPWDIKEKIKTYYKDVVIEELTVSGLVASVFALFIFTQFKTFSFILSGFNSGKLNPAIFVREGFGQLFIACILGLSIFHFLKHDTQAKYIHHLKKWLFRMALILLAEITLVSFVAGERVWLYQQIFGFTRARIWGLTSLAFLFSVLALLFAELKQKISKGMSMQVYLLVASVLLLFLGWVNIDRVVAIEKPPIVEGKVDWYYISQLSFDAFPAWEKYLESATPETFTICQDFIQGKAEASYQNCFSTWKMHYDQAQTVRSLTYRFRNQYPEWCNPPSVSANANWLSLNTSVDENRKSFCEKYPVWRDFYTKFQEVSDALQHTTNR